MSNLKKVLRDTREVFRTKWSPEELVIPTWAIRAVVIITIIRSLSYGIELLVLVTNNPISPMMAFAAIFGIQLWGILMLIGISIVVAGILFKRTIVVTIGTLLCAGVWAAFALCLGFGWFDTGSGGRFFVAAAATASMWTVYFIIQLKSIVRNGVGYHD